jgi:hypothetical protein
LQVFIRLQCRVETGIERAVGVQADDTEMGIIRLPGWIYIRERPSDNYATVSLEIDGDGETLSSLRVETRIHEGGRCKAAIDQPGCINAVDGRNSAAHRNGEHGFVVGLQSQSAPHKRR